MQNGIVPLALSLLCGSALLLAMPAFAVSLDGYHVAWGSPSQDADPATGIAGLRYLLTKLTSFDPSPRWTVPRASVAADGVVTSGPVTRVVPHNGAPTLALDGCPLTIPGYSNYYPNPPYLADFVKAGTRLYDTPGTASVWDGNASHTTWTAPDTFNYSTIDSCMQNILSANPNALIIPRIYVGTPAWWLDANQDQLEVLSNGSTLCGTENGIRPAGIPFPSLASAKWRQDMGSSLEKLIDHLEQQGWMRRVVGFKISGLMTEEWYHWTAGGGNPELAGYSPVTGNAFRQWLRRHYGNDVNVLRDSWNNGSVTFDTAEVPTKEQRMRNQNARTFRDPANDQNVIDWERFYNELIPDTMNYFGGVIKAKTNNTKIVGGFYGFMHEFRGNPEFGHNALSKYIASPNLDFIYVTASYGNQDNPPADVKKGIAGSYQRGLGGADYPRGAAASVNLHGKLWYNNNDYRTLLAPARMKSIGYSDAAMIDNLIMGGYTPGLDQNRWMLRRHAGFVACGGMYEDIFDIDGAYYRDDSLAAEIKMLNDFAGRTAIHDRASASQILVVSDELSTSYSTFCSWDNALLNTSLYAPPSQLAKLGAPVDYVLLDDLGLIGPDPYRMVVFLNCFHMFDHQRQAVARFKKDGKLLVFCYAPGYFNHRTASDDNMLSLTGIKVYASSSETMVPQRIRIDNGVDAHALARALHRTGHAEFGPTRNVGKAFTVADPSAHVLGRKPGTATCTMAYRDMGSWKSVYSVTADMPDGIWRELARHAGVHLYNDKDDTLYANKSYVTIHANGAGPRTVRFPKNGRIYDALSETLITTGNSVSKEYQHGETMIYRYEDPAQPR